MAAQAGIMQGNIQHHDQEQEQHRDRPDINDDQDKGEKLGPSSRNKPAALIKARIRNSTACTGCRAATTMTAAKSNTLENRIKSRSCAMTIQVRDALRQVRNLS